MSGPQFFETRMGARYYERTLPELVQQLTRLNDLIEHFVRQVELDRDAASASSSAHPTASTSTAPAGAP